MIQDIENEIKNSWNPCSYCKYVLTVETKDPCLSCNVADYTAGNYPDGYPSNFEHKEKNKTKEVEIMGNTGHDVSREELQKQLSNALETINEQRIKIDTLRSVVNKDCLKWIEDEREKLQSFIVYDHNGEIVGQPEYNKIASELRMHREYVTQLHEEVLRLRRIMLETEDEK